MDVNAFIGEHGARVRGMIRHQRIRESDVEDVFQEVLIAIHRFDESKLTGPFACWLSGMVRNQSKLHHRRSAKTYLSNPIEEHMDLPARDATPDPILRRRFDSVWNKLTPLQQESLFMYHAEDQTASAIANSLGATKNAIRMRIRFGTKTMRDAVGAIL